MLQAMPWEYRVITDPDGTFSAEGFLREDQVRQYRSANGLCSEAEARQWVYQQQAQDRREGVADGTEGQQSSRRSSQ